MSKLPFRHWLNRSNKFLQNNCSLILMSKEKNTFFALWWKLETFNWDLPRRIKNYSYLQRWKRLMFQKLFRKNLEADDWEPNCGSQTCNFLEIWVWIARSITVHETFGSSGQSRFQDWKNIGFPNSHKWVSGFPLERWSKNSNQYQ